VGHPFNLRKKRWHEHRKGNAPLPAGRYHADVHVAPRSTRSAAARVRDSPVTPAGYAGLLGLAGRVRDRLPGPDRRDRQLRRRPVPPRHRRRRPRRRAAAPTARTAAVRASPTRWTRVSAARAAQSGRARGAPKGRDGAVEAIRALMVVKRSAGSERTQNDQPGPGP